ncbi:D-threo-aldose 1-dehydrogenase [Planctomycetes bacterium Pan216]|uniref:D-threo-aldose 1-dehydrogenase n=1 Tax=Kolteria novifilia TaxID=2527975 RepID=A0A518B041_9BACT|nr:D-threo-aldose 1-dehydrogenase [Planctomycetes bacterium Pan216]
MKKRPLGKTGLHVGELSLGGLFTSSLAGGTSETIRILPRAIELGINYVDTAPAYADSEATLGTALASVSEPLVLSTKLGGRPQPFDARDTAALRESFEESLRLLGRKRVELLLIHEPDRPQQYDWWTNQERAEGPVIDLLLELKREGLVGAIGLAGTTSSELYHLVATGKFDVVLTAFNYNVLYREAAIELIPTATQLGMGIIIASSLGQGFLARRFDEEVRRRPVWLAKPRQEQFAKLYAFLDDIGMSLPEIGLRFAISHPDISTVLVGPKTTAQLEESVALVEKGPLPANLLDRLDEIAAMVPHRPFEEPMILPFGKSYHGPGLANLGAGVPIGKTD